MLSGDRSRKRRRCPHSLDGCPQFFAHDTILEYLLSQFEQRRRDWGDETKVSGYVPGYRDIGQKGFRFPFGDSFGMAIDNHGDTQILGAKG